VVLTTNGNGYNLLAKSCHTPNEKVLKKVHSKKRLLSTFRRKRSFWPYNERVRFGRKLFLEGKSKEAETEEDN